MQETIEIHVIKKQLTTENCKHISYIINQDTFNVDMKDVLTIKKFNDNDVYSPRTDNCLTVCFIQRYLDDIGDYDYDDNYEPFYVEEEMYYPINYDPTIGAEYVFVVDKEIDVQVMFDAYNKEYSQMSKHRRKTKKQHMRFEELIRIIDSFYENYRFVDNQEYERILKEGEKYE